MLGAALLLAAVGLACGPLTPALAGGAHHAAKPKCYAKGKRHPRHAKPCHPKAKRHTPPPSAPPAANPPSSQPTVSPSPVTLTPAELESFDAINKQRAEHGVGALSTSAPLQAIAEKRVREMAEQQSDYAGHDVYVDLKDAGLCTRSQREISGVDISRAALEEQEKEEREHLPHPLAMAALDREEEEQKALEIPTEAKWTVLAVAILEVGSQAYYVEDFAQGC